jgi:hypothetical protein
MMENRYNASVLDAELRAAGLDIVGCCSTGRIDWKQSPSPAEKKKADAILKAHDPKALSPRNARIEALRSKRKQGKALSPQEMKDAIDLFLRV